MSEQQNGSQKCQPYYLRDGETVCQCVLSGLEEEHDERYECRVCRKCCGDEPTLARSFDTYDDKGCCIPCSLEEDKDLTIEEVAEIFNR